MAFGILILVERSNGDLFCVDGQHRVGAAMLRDDILELPALVFPLSDEDAQRLEALSFYRVNNQRKSMSAIERFRALVVAEDEEAVDLQALLDDYGLALGVNPNTPNQFAGIVEAQRIFAKSRERLAILLGIAKPMCQDHAIPSLLLRALNVVYEGSNGELDQRRYTNRLIRAGWRFLYSETRKRAALEP